MEFRLNPGSLQQLCRQRINVSTKTELFVDQLPIPSTLRDYCKKKYYYDNFYCHEHITPVTLDELLPVINGGDMGIEQFLLVMKLRHRQLDSSIHGKLFTFIHEFTTHPEIPVRMCSSCVRAYHDYHGCSEYVEAWLGRVDIVSHQFLLDEIQENDYYCFSCKTTPLFSVLERESWDKGPKDTRTFDLSHRSRRYKLVDGQWRNTQL